MSTRGRLLGTAILLSLLVFSRPAVCEIISVAVEEDLQSAIDTAAEGDTLLLLKGNHRGPITINKQLSLRGEPNAHLVGTGEGSVLTIAADGVEVEGIEITNSGHDLSRDNAGILVLGNKVSISNVRLRKNLHGIYVRGGKNVRLFGNDIRGLAADEDFQPTEAELAANEDAIHHNPPSVQALFGNGIHLWDATGAVVENCRIRYSRDGIYVSFTHKAVFRGNSIDSSRYAIHYMYSSNNSVLENELWNNVAGAALMFSRELEVRENVLRDHGGFRAYGLLLQNIDTSEFEGNEIRANRVGLRLQNSSANRFRNNRIATNLTGVTINSSSRDNTFTRNRIGPNLREMELTGPVPPTDWSSDGIGNYWHGVLPMDLNGDGISEWPHHEVDILSRSADDFPYVQLLLGSPGVSAVEWAISRAPIPGTRYITDWHPLTRERSDD